MEYNIISIFLERIPLELCDEPHLPRARTSLMNVKGKQFCAMRAWKRELGIDCLGIVGDGL